MASESRAAFSPKPHQPQDSLGGFSEDGTWRCPRHSPRGREADGGGTRSASEGCLVKFKRETLDSLAPWERMRPQATSRDEDLGLL